MAHNPKNIFNRAACKRQHMLRFLIKQRCNAELFQIGERINIQSNLKMKNSTFYGIAFSVGIQVEKGGIASCIYSSTEMESESESNARRAKERFGSAPNRAQQEAHSMKCPSIISETLFVFLCRSIRLFHTEHILSEFPQLECTDTVVRCTAGINISPPPVC